MKYITKKFEGYGYRMNIELNKAQYLNEEPIKITVITHKNIQMDQIKIFELYQEITCDLQVSKKKDGYQIEIKGLPCGNYIFQIVCDDIKNETSFDIVKSRKEVVRYGFLADFDEENLVEDIQCMKNWHINAIQFYDWMFRHDQLVSQLDEYKEPLGRPIKNSVLKEKINKCKEYGIRPFAYGAVYAATKETYEEHPEWALYTLDGELMIFANWLFFMNISKTSGWRNHIIKEYQKAISELGFQGIHMDTYGFPKNVFDINKQKVNLSESFRGMIDEAAKVVEDIDLENGVIFNAVNNWPIDNVAKSNQDVVYIEVWPPNVRYYDLYILIQNARRLSKKNVVLAAYMEPFKNQINEEKDSSKLNNSERSFLLTYAVICASGGTHLALGEKESILSDSYYVNYSKLRKIFLPKVKKYTDFLVAYADVLYNDYGTDISMTASNGINEDIVFFSKQTTFSSCGEANKVWTIIREQKNRISIHMINLNKNNGNWNEEKKEPQVISDIYFQIRYDQKMKGIYVSSPDNDTILAKEISYEMKHSNCGRIYKAKLPRLFLWSTVIIEME